MGEQPQEGSLDEAREMARDAGGWLKRRGCLFWGVVAVAVLYMVGRMAPPPAGDANKAAKQAEVEAAAALKDAAAAASDAARPLDVTANELFRAYQDNELAAKQRYGGRLLKVSGTVDGVDLDLSDDPVLRLVTDNQFMSAMVKFDTPDLAALGALHKGQKVTAVCPRLSEVAGRPVLYDCVLVK